MRLVVMPQGRTGQGNSAGAKAPIFGPCYNCNQRGHFSKYCPHPKKKQAVYPGHVHYTTIEEILEGEPMTTSMFPINQHMAVVLFDSGSLHSFMSQAFA
jgi:hypothetical protein